MGWLDEIKKAKKRRDNMIYRERHDYAQNQSMAQKEMRGEEVRITGVGSDYRHRKQNPYTGEKAPWIHTEIKTGGSQKTVCQRKTAKKHKGHYEEERYYRD